MIDLGNLSQLEIEQEFDKSKVVDDIHEQVREYADSIHSEYPNIEKIMLKYLENVEFEDIDKVMIPVLSILGNQRAGILLGVTPEGDIKPLARGMVQIDARDIPFNVFVKTLYKDKYIQSMFMHESLNFVMDLVVELDQIFFEIVKRVELVEDGQFRTFTYCRSELLFEDNISLRAKYERFRLPLIEKPLDWTTEHNGGYHLHQSRCITNMGTSKQPQQVLNALNKLQSQGYKHQQNEEMELAFNFNKFVNDGDTKRTAMEKAKSMLLTAQDTYEAIGNRTIYFEWRFDSRGRMYSTGYDINLQGNKAKKGALRPVLWND